jgi:transcription elongation factor GreA-like protein
MMSSKIFTDFIKKHKIAGLENFRSMEDLSSLEKNMKQRNKLVKELQDFDAEISKMSKQL